MFTLSPNDHPTKGRTSMNTARNGNFGGNRRVTEDIQKDEDYTKPSLERRANVAEDVEEKIFNPVEDTTKDLDDLNDPDAKKRENARRAETFNLDRSDRKFREPLPAGQEHPDTLEADADARPEMDGREDEHRKPNPEKKHGDRNVWRIGQDRDKPEDQNIGPTVPGPR